MGDGLFINTAILFEPINWLLVIVVLIFVSYAAFLLYQRAGGAVSSIA